MGAAYVFGAVVCAPPMDAHVVWADTRVRPYAMRRMAHIGGRCAHCRPWGAMICGVGGHTGPPLRHGGALRTHTPYPSYATQSGARAAMLHWGSRH